MKMYHFKLSTHVLVQPFCCTRDLFNFHSMVTEAQYIYDVDKTFNILELEFFLRPTVSRPVRLGIGPPFGTLDQILSYSSFFV
jgi:hypothetical protein